MIWDTIGLQLFFTAISAVSGAGVLLWLQTKYERIKLLRGLEEEVQQNLHTIGKVGHHLHKSKNMKAVGQADYYDNIYRTLMVDTPILYTRLMTGLSPIPNAYQDISHLKNIGGITDVRTNEIGEVLQYLESVEEELYRSMVKIEQVQQDNILYRLYSRVFLDEDNEGLKGMYLVIESDGDNLEENIWRPSGVTTEEKEEELRDKIPD